MGRMKQRRTTRWLAAAAATATLTVALAGGPAQAATSDFVDEIMYVYGDTPDSVVLLWRGPATKVFYGATASYGLVAAAKAGTIVPVDIAGPFMRAVITGLTPGVTYHYRVGSSGLDHTLHAAPADDFTAVDVGDTGSTLCRPWLAAQQALIAAQQPDFVTHGGDLSYANECSPAAVHQYFQDQQVWSQWAAFQPAWGNHEYASPNAESPPEAVTDSLANYKGRIPLTHAQTLSSDTATRTTNPGCAGPRSGNNCRGNDWGWFQVGGVLYISYPEPWLNAYRDWQLAAGPLMARAQADPTVDFIVTYGHRPAWSSATAQVNADLLAAVIALAAGYSPNADHPDGKYVLNVAHHVHAEEVFDPVNGLVEINNGGGGAGQLNFTTVAANSILRIRHPAIMRSRYSRAGHTLTVTLLCGTVYTPNPKDPCDYGSELYTRTFTR
jgi:hypothetical protein